MRQLKLTSEPAKALMALAVLAACLAITSLMALNAAAQVAEDRTDREPIVIKGTLRRCGPIAIYIHSFPISAEQYQVSYTSPILVSLSVWGTSHEDPVLIYCDGREVARIEGPGYYMVQLSLTTGYHHLAIMCQYGVFASATFFVKLPEAKPAPEAIPVPEVQAMLEALRREVWRNCLIAACAGVMAGYALKRASKIEFRQLYVPFMMLIAIPFIRLEWLAAIWPSLSVPDLFATTYWLVPFGLTAILAYHFVRDFAEWRGYMYFEPNRVAGDVFPLWGEYYIAGLRPIREILLGRGLLIYKRFMARNAATIEFEFAGEVYVVYVLRSLEDIQETEDAFILRCDKALARALVRADILKVVDKELSELRLEVMAYREMVKTAAFRAMSVIDEFFATTPVDRLTFLNVDEIREQLKARVMRELGEIPASQVQAATGVAAQAQGQGGGVGHGEEGGA